MDHLEMRNKRAKLIEEMRGILDLADSEKRELSAEEVEKYDRIEGDVRKLGENIKRVEGQRKLEEGLGEPLYTPADTGQGEGTRDNNGEEVRFRATPEYRNLFWEVMQSRAANPPEARDLFKGDDTKGGYLVPESFETELIRALEDVNVMRALASVRSSATLDKIPVASGRPVFSWLGEKETYSETDTEFGQVVMDAHKGGGIVKVSEELMEDSYVNLEAELRYQFGLGQGDLEEAAFISGTGHECPRGVILDASLGKTAASATAIAADELFDIKYALRKPYRKRATWMMNDSSALSIMKLKDGDGQYLWRAGLQAGQPDILLNSALETSTSMPEIGTGNTSILYGDFSFYRIHDRLGIQIQKLIELYAASGQVGFKIRFRTDGRLLMAEAIKRLTHP